MLRWSCGQGLPKEWRWHQEKERLSLLLGGVSGETCEPGLKALQEAASLAIGILGRKSSICGTSHRLAAGVSVHCGRKGLTLENFKCWSENWNK